jgi:hypothetical protein
MRKRVYLETTIFSYLAGRPSRDLVTAAHQQVTWDWWTHRRKLFDLFISEVVEREVGAGDPQAASRRMGFIEGLQVLDVSDDAGTLAEAIIQAELLPGRAAQDALHLGIAVYYGMDYLLTWNCRHLANAELVEPLGSLLKSRGFKLPVVCTPEELMGELQCPKI